MEQEKDNHHRRVQPVRRRAGRRTFRTWGRCHHQDNDAFRKLPPNFSGFQIVGNVTDPDLLEDAGIGNASVVVAATDDDNINCMLAQMARRIYDVGEVFARLNDTDKEHLIGGLNIKAIYPARLSIEKFKELSSIAF